MRKRKVTFLTVCAWNKQTKGKKESTNKAKRQGRKQKERKKERIKERAVYTIRWSTAQNCI
jgi:hypothetical protein